MAGCFARVLVLALALVAAASGALLGVDVPTGAGLNVSVGTELLQGLRTGPAVTVGLCGRTACCGVRVSGYYNAHPGQADAFQYENNNLMAASRIAQTEKDPMNIPYWLVEKDIMTLTVRKNHRLLRIDMMTTCGEYQRYIQVLCPADATRLVVESSTVGNHWVEVNGATVRGPMLHPGQLVTLTVTVAASTSPSSLHVGLCDDKQCGTVVVTNPDMRELAFASGITVTNNPNGEFLEVYQESAEPVVWDAGVYEFTLAFHPDGFLQAWLKPDSMAEVPVPGWGAQALELKALHPAASIRFDSAGVRSVGRLPVPHLTAPLLGVKKSHRIGF